MPKNEPELHMWINETVQLLEDQKYKLNTKVHWIFMGFTDFPECANSGCTNKIGIDHNVSWNAGYSRYCSLKCGTKCSRDKCNETLHKHAAENPKFFNEIELKKKKTRFKNHGDPNWNNRESAHKTCLERLGVKCPIGNKEVLAKSLKTREKKYGKGNLTNYKKTQQTCLKLYGKKNVWSVPEIHRKCIDKTVELHGSPNPGNKYEIDGFKFDSKPEIAFYIWLRDNDIEFTCKPTISFEFMHNGQIHRYYPDFIVEGQITEIKGDHFFEDCNPSKKMINPFLKIQDGYAEEKHQCMLANNVKIITSCEYIKYMSYVENKYGKHYIDSLKKNNV